MKYECKSCGLECAVDTNFEPTVCLKTGIICYGWHKVTAPAPKPLSYASKSAESATQKDLSCKSETLPDWCKVGAWVWNESQGRFARITAIGQRIQLLDLTEQKGYMDDVDCLKPVRVRPWTFDEAPLGFKTKDDVFILLYIQDKQEWGYWAKKECEEYTLAEVAELIQADGSPCGVLEVEVGK